MAMQHAPAEDASAPRLSHLPVAFFSSVMGLSGLTLAWMKAEHVLGIVTPVPALLGATAAVVFVLVAVAYVAKIALHREAVVEEYHHPVKLHFLPTVSISLILLSIIALVQLPAAALPLFAFGVALHFALTLTVLHNWFNKEHFQTAHLNPAWFIPIVGNVLVPLIGVPLGFIELSWFFFSIGIVFWVVLFAIIVNRVLFHNPLPERLSPTLFILIAPPAVGFLSYVKLGGEVDAFARVLYYFALFLTIFLGTQLPRLMRSRFFLSWWAYSFPLAAITVATFEISAKLGDRVLHGAGVFLLGAVTLAVAGLVARTLVAVRRHEICLPE